MRRFSFTGVVDGIQSSPVEVYAETEKDAWKQFLKNVLGLPDFEEYDEALESSLVVGCPLFEMIECTEDTE